MSRAEHADPLYRQVLGGLTRYVNAARSFIMAPWQGWRGLPDPYGAMAAAPTWSTEVAAILAMLDDIAQDSADEAAHAFLRRTAEVKLSQLVQASLLASRNQLAGIPNEVAALVQEQLANGLRAGEDNEALARRVDDLLVVAGSPRWPSRARTITTTELTRAWGAGQTAYGLNVQHTERTSIFKRWDGIADDAERPAHRAANGQTVPVAATFNVGGQNLMWPGEATSTPENGINCRCSMNLLRGGDRG